MQIPSWDARLFDLKRAAESKAYCDEIAAVAARHKLVISELSTHLQGQLVACHPAYDAMFDGFAAATPSTAILKRARPGLSSSCIYAARASTHFGMKAHVTFSGALAWPYIYPWPQRPAGLVETAFDELAKRWLPILNAFDEAGVDLCYEIHPGEDLHDGATFEMFLDRVRQHPRCNLLYDPSHFVLQQLDYLQFIDFYHSRIKMFHVKDAEFRPTGKQGVYGGYQPWLQRAGRFRSLGRRPGRFSPPSFQSSLNMIFPAGPFSNGSAASRAANREPGKALLSSSATSSKRRRLRLTISPVPAPIKKHCAKSSVFPTDKRSPGNAPILNLKIFAHFEAARIWTGRIAATGSERQSFAL